MRKEEYLNWILNNNYYIYEKMNARTFSVNGKINSNNLETNLWTRFILSFQKIDNDIIEIISMTMFYLSLSEKNFNYSNYRITFLILKSFIEFPVSKDVEKKLLIDLLQINKTMYLLEKSKIEDIGQLYNILKQSNSDYIETIIHLFKIHIKNKISLNVNNKTFEDMNFFHIFETFELEKYNEFLELNKKDITKKLPNLYIPIGISGSGKSNFFEKRLKENNLLYISTDQLRKELFYFYSKKEVEKSSIKEAFEFFDEDKEKRKEIRSFFNSNIEYLTKSNKKDVFIDDTNLSEEDRNFLLNNLKDKYKIIYILFIPRIKILQKRFEERKKKNDKTNKYSEFNQILNSFKRIDFPGFYEYDQIEIII